MEWGPYDDDDDNKILVISRGISSGGAFVAFANIFATYLAVAFVLAGTRGLANHV